MVTERLISQTYKARFVNRSKLMTRCTPSYSWLSRVWWEHKRGKITAVRIGVGAISRPSISRRPRKAASALAGRRLMRVPRSAGSTYARFSLACLRRFTSARELGLRPGLMVLPHGYPVERERYRPSSRVWGACFLRRERRRRQWISIADKCLEKIASFTSHRPPPVAMEAWRWSHPLFGSNRQWKKGWSWHGSKGGFPRDGRNPFLLQVCRFFSSVLLLPLE